MSRCWSACAAAAVASLGLSREAALADGTGPTGVEVGWRTGYSLPMGDAVGLPDGGRSLPLDEIVTRALPIWIDAGFRLSPHVFAGADFKYARALVSTQQGCPVPSVNCQASDVVAGAQATFHLAPGAKFDPWGGIGVGYESLRVDTNLSGGAFHGWDLTLQLGGDYKPIQRVGLGPFVAFGLGAFLGCSSSTSAPCHIPVVGLHEWLTIGIRVALDIHVGK